MIFAWDRPSDFRLTRHDARRGSLLEAQLRKEYDFSVSRRNPYAKQLKRQVTIRLDTIAIDHFKHLAAEVGIPYQNLMNLFLRDCAIEKRRPTVQWLRPGAKQPTGR